MTKRVVFGISDWPEELGHEFPIIEIIDGESDEDAVNRARIYYDSKLECVIKEVGDQPAENRCPRCNYFAMKGDHTCPFKCEITEDRETTCNCCSECTAQCAMDV